MIFEESPPNNIDLNHKTPTPLYYQLKQILLRKIKNGEYDPNEPIPTEKELQEIYEVSRITVRRAMSELVSDGYLIRQAGRGTFVIPKKIDLVSSKLGHLREDLIEQGYDVTTKILESGQIQVPKHVAAKLKIEEDTPVFLLRRLICVDGEPLLITTGFHNYGSEVNISREELEASSLFQLMENHYGGYRTERSIEATLALEHEAALLQIKPNLPLLLVELLVEDQNGVPRSFVKALYRGDRYKYRHVIQSGSLTVKGRNAHLYTKE